MGQLLIKNQVKNAYESHDLLPTLRLLNLLRACSDFESEQALSISIPQLHKNLLPYD